MLYPWALSPPGGISETILARAQQLKGSKVGPVSGTGSIQSGMPWCQLGCGDRGGWRNNKRRGKENFQKATRQKDFGLLPQTKDY